MEVKGYKKVPFKDLQNVMNKRKEELEKPEVNIAAEINVKSVSTVRNVLNEPVQQASDEVLTKVLKTLNLQGYVLWVNGERNYYISLKN